MTDSFMINLLIEACIALDKQGFFFTSLLSRPYGEDFKKQLLEAGQNTFYEDWPPAAGIHIYWVGKIENRTAAFEAVARDLRANGHGDLIPPGKPGGF